jgi:hypothetical protein
VTEKDSERRTLKNPAESIRKQHDIVEIKKKVRYNTRNAAFDIMRENAALAKNVANG